MSSSPNFPGISRSIRLIFSLSKMQRIASLPTSASFSRESSGILIVVFRIVVDICCMALQAVERAHLFMHVSVLMLIIFVFMFALLVASSLGFNIALLNLNERGMSDDRLNLLLNRLPPRCIVLLEVCPPLDLCVETHCNSGC